MRKNNYLRSFSLAAVLATGTFTFTGCDKENETPAGAYAENAVLISNEGSFGRSNASVSYYNRSTGKAENNIFGRENDQLILGDVLQDISLHNDKAYLVMNNSQKIVVANANTFKAEGEVTGLSTPRYFAALNNSKGYVTEWLDYDPVTFEYSNGRISVIDLSTNAVIKQIEVGVQPEQLVIAGGKVYAGHAGSNFVSVINTTTDEAENPVMLTYGPRYLAVDRNNNLWALSTGLKSWALPPAQHTAGALTKIALSNNTVSSTYVFASNTASSGKLAVNGNKDALYYEYNGNVYKQDVNTASLNTNALLKGGFYGLGIDPATGYIYGGKAPNFTSDGWVVRYNTTGAAIDSFRAGVAPNGFAFR